MKVQLAFIYLIVIGYTHRVLPEYEINLDLPIALRNQLIVQDFIEPMKETIDIMLNDKLKLLTPVLRRLAKIRGPETQEMWQEISFYAEAANVSVYDLQIINWLYELSTIMVPRILMDYNIEDLSIFGAEMCTGILAYDQDGSVNHARNLDFYMPSYLNRLLYIGKFTRDGKEIFRAQMIAGFAGVLTGFKSGVLSVEINTRYSQAFKQNIETFYYLMLNRHPLALWEVRKTLENTDSYDAAVNQLTQQKFTAPIYLVFSGAKQGIIIARDPEDVAHKIVLGVDHPKYIVITNFDYWNNDWREYFDPSANFYRRRIGVQRALDGLDIITKDDLFNTLNRYDVKAIDTIYQGVMNVKSGYFQSTSPFD